MGAAAGSHGPLAMSLSLIPLQVLLYGTRLGKSGKGLLTMTGLRGGTQGCRPGEISILRPSKIYCVIASESINVF